MTEGIKHRAVFNGKPYFIVERESGLFEVVKGLYIKEGENITTPETGEGNPLRLGLDIIEVPTRGIKLLVENMPNDFHLQIAVEELRKFCSVSGMDYVSYEPYGANVSLIRGSNGITQYHEVRPRLFRKVVDD